MSRKKKNLLLLPLFNKICSFRLKSTSVFTHKLNKVRFSVTYTKGFALLKSYVSCLHFCVITKIWKKPTVKKYGGEERNINCPLLCSAQRYNAHFLFIYSIWGFQVTFWWILTPKNIALDTVSMWAPFYNYLDLMILLFQYWPMLDSTFNIKDRQDRLLILY